MFTLSCLLSKSDTYIPILLSLIFAVEEKGLLYIKGAEQALFMGGEAERWGLRDIAASHPGKMRSVFLFRGDLPEEDAGKTKVGGRLHQEAK